MRSWRGLLPLLLLGLVAQAQGAASTAHYRQVLTQQGFSAPVLYDLGGAWLAAGHPGRAILQYQRALVLAPRDPALQQALARARDRAGISVTPPDSWTRMAGALTVDAWSWIALLSLFALCGALAWLACGKRGPWSKAIALVGACGVVIAADALVLDWPTLDLAVVVQGPAAVRIAPADAADPSFELHDGETVYLAGRFHDFERVSTADGRSGWLRADQALPVRLTAAEAAAEDMPP